MRSAESRHRLLPLIVLAVLATHLAVSSVWAMGVRKAGIGAVTWGVRYCNYNDYKVLNLRQIALFYRA